MTSMFPELPAIPDVSDPFALLVGTPNTAPAGQPSNATPGLIKTATGLAAGAPLLGAGLGLPYLGTGEDAASKAAIAVSSAASKAVTSAAITAKGVSDALIPTGPMTAVQAAAAGVYNAFGTNLVTGPAGTLLTGALSGADGLPVSTVTGLAGLVKPSTVLKLAETATGLTGTTATLGLPLPTGDLTTPLLSALDDTGPLGSSLDGLVGPFGPLAGASTLLKIVTDPDSGTVGSDLPGLNSVTGPLGTLTTVLDATKLLANPASPIGELGNLATALHAVTNTTNEFGALTPFVGTVGTAVTDAIKPMLSATGSPQGGSNPIGFVNQIVGGATTAGVLATLPVAGAAPAINGIITGVGTVFNGTTADPDGPLGGLTGPGGPLAGLGLADLSGPGGPLAGLGLEDLTGPGGPLAIVTGPGGPLGGEGEMGAAVVPSTPSVPGLDVLDALGVGDILGQTGPAGSLLAPVQEILGAEGPLGSTLAPVLSILDGGVMTAAEEPAPAGPLDPITAIVGGGTSPLKPVTDIVDSVLGGGQGADESPLKPVTDIVDSVLGGGDEGGDDPGESPLDLVLGEDGALGSLLGGLGGGA